MSAAEIIQFIRDKWNEIGQNNILARAFIEESRNHILDGGGVLWIKYDSLDVLIHPTWTFIPKGSELWEQIPIFVSNFDELARDYNPEKHCLMFLSVPNGNRSMGQLTRVNYERVPLPLGPNPEYSVPSQESDGTLMFRLV